MALSEVHLFLRRCLVWYVPPTPLKPGCEGFFDEPPSVDGRPNDGAAPFAFEPCIQGLGFGSWGSNAGFWV